MFLEQLSVENLRALKSTGLDFTSSSELESTRKWTLLVGENGTCKSTLLKAAGLLLGGSDCLPHLLEEPGSWVRRGAKECVLRARLRTAEWQPRDIELRIVLEDSSSEVIHRNRAGLEAIDSALKNSPRNYFVAGYGPYRRLVENHGSKELSPSSRGPIRAQSLATLFDKNALVNPLPAWAMGLEYRQGEAGLAIVRDAMNALLPDMTFAGIDRKAGDLMFDTLDGPVPLRQLSDGYQNVAAWIGDLLFRVTEAFANYQNPLQARGLLLIDEVDAHLHPSWQRRLRAFLDDKLPNFQIIATTHSPLTVQQFRGGEVYMLVRTRDDADAVKLVPFPEDPSKLRVHQLYDLAFDIETLDSLEIEQSKNLYRTLTQKRSREPLTDREEDQLRAVTETLEKLPGDRDDALGNEALESFFAKADQIVAELGKRGTGNDQA